MKHEHAIRALNTHNRMLAQEYERIVASNNGFGKIKHIQDALDAIAENMKDIEGAMELLRQRQDIAIDLTINHL